MKLRWDKGGEAEVTQLEGDAVTLRSTLPSPPGSRLSDKSLSLTVKVHTSRRQPDGSFLIAGRLVDVTREVRSKIIDALATTR
jgi:hypothetical protein